MKVLSISELLCLTLTEIKEIERSILIQLTTQPEGSIERVDSIATLQNIRMVLARPEFRGVRHGTEPPAP